MFRIYSTSAQTATNGFGRVYQTVSSRVAGQPSWIVRAAVTAALVVFVGVVLLLVIPAVVIGVVVMTVLAAGYALKQRVSRWLGRWGRGGALPNRRRNVRVIERREM
jgi:hypothetical protein